jgi:hypothetical protein
MKRLIMRTFVVLAITGGAAAADPPSATPPTAPADPSAPPSAISPTYELELAGQVGNESGPAVEYTAASLQAGVRAGPFVWARATLLAGEARSTLVLFCPVGVPCTQPTGHIYQARVGLEARGCSTGSIVCGFGGVDAAFTAIQFYSGNVVLLLPRVGLDIGSRHVRLRIALELGVDGKADVAAGLDAGIAYRW